MTALRRKGSIVWAISAYDVQEPFRVVEHDGSERRYPDARSLSQDVLQRKLAGEFDLAITAKLRPVLLLQERPAGRFEDFAALRLVRLEKFAAADQQTIRNGDEETLFYLGHNNAKYGMDKEHAVVLTSLHRVHKAAIASAPVGAVDQAELRTVCERLVKVSDLDLANLITRKAAELIERLKQRGR